MNGIFYYELLPSNQNNNSEQYRSQFNRVKTNIQKGRPNLANRKVIVKLYDIYHCRLCQNWGNWFGIFSSTHLILHYLIWSLQNSLDCKNFHSQETCKMHLLSFFAEKDGNFWEDEIMKLPAQFQKVVDPIGKYVVE